MSLSRNCRALTSYGEKLCPCRSHRFVVDSASFARDFTHARSFATKPQAGSTATVKITTAQANSRPRPSPKHINILSSAPSKPELRRPTIPAPFPSPSSNPKAVKVPSVPGTKPLTAPLPEPDAVRAAESRERTLRAARLLQQEMRKKKAEEERQKLEDDKKYKKRYKSAARKWTSTIVAMPILLVTSYFLFGRCEYCLTGALAVWIEAD